MQQKQIILMKDIQRGHPLKTHVAIPLIKYGYKLLIKYYTKLAVSLKEKWKKGYFYIFKYNKIIINFKKELCIVRRKFL